MGQSLPRRLILQSSNPAVTPPPTSAPTQVQLQRFSSEASPRGVGFGRGAHLVTPGSEPFQNPTMLAEPDGAHLGLPCPSVFEEILSTVIRHPPGLL